MGAEILDLRAGQARCQLILGSHEAILVDAGSDGQARAIVAALDSVGLGHAMSAPSS